MRYLMPLSRLSWLSMMPLLLVLSETFWKMKTPRISKIGMTIRFGVSVNLIPWPVLLLPRRSALCPALEVSPTERRFNTLYDRENKGNDSSACGRGVVPVYDYIPVDQKGHCKLVQVGEENRQGIIESWEESVDIHALLSRYLDGDANALERRQAMFADITGLPDNVHAYHDAATTAQSVFDSLSDDVRHFYGDSVSEFLQGIFSGRFPPTSDEVDNSGDDPAVES